MKKLVAFDLDDTLTVTKQPISQRMGGLLLQLTAGCKVAIITGGRYEQLQQEVVDKLQAAPEQLAQLYLMPLSGAYCYHYDAETNEWQSTQYFEAFSDDENQHIAATLEQVARKLGYWEENPAGDIIELRGTQVTYSALGQEADPDAKYAWDPTYQKRREMQKVVIEALPECTVSVNGNTSLDITKKGSDKGYGMQCFMQEYDLQSEDILFFGDQFQEGGNDFPIKALGIDTVSVVSWQETAVAVETILAENEETR